MALRGNLKNISGNYAVFGEDSSPVSFHGRGPSSHTGRLRYGQEMTISRVTSSGATEFLTVENSHRTAEPRDLNVGMVEMVVGMAKLAKPSAQWVTFEEYDNSPRRIIWRAVAPIAVRAENAFEGQSITAGAAFTLQFLVSDTAMRGPQSQLRGCVQGTVNMREVTKVWQTYSWIDHTLHMDAAVSPNGLSTFMVRLDEDDGSFTDK